MYMKRRRVMELPYELMIKIVVVFLFMLVLFVAVIFFLPEKTAAAGNEAVRTYNITSVKIEEGDSLWTIASDYYTEEFDSIPAYISEIKRMNGLTSDTLYAGHYILVPYYMN